MFKTHLDMIGRNETPSKKARFWQSFVRSLKGSEDIRAEERYRPTRRSVFPELLSTYPYSKSIYDDPIAAAERITVPGYRYLPVHREIYGYSPRPIYAHNYPRSLDYYRPIYHVPRRVRRGVDPFDAHKAWQDHLDRLAAIDRLYPSRYGLYLKDRAYPITDFTAPLIDPLKPKSLKGIEYEPDNKPHWGTGAWPARISDVFKKDPFFAEAEKWAGFDRSLRGKSPTPVKPRISQPRETEVAFDADGAPLYSVGGLRRRPWADIFNPSPSLPISAITRDPFWHDWPELKPIARWDRSPSYIRDSYLSPVKRTFLWDKHPIRPLDLMLDAELSVGELGRTLPFIRSL
ncbi:myofilin isoform X1 [Bombyx mori]|uniref:Myofilin variant A n=1 Tax=Bombyx mori TaxID=7091 RepID=A0A8R2C704_BOMMO|nr:myofilin isoform X1 [Bombyx mori]XP_021204936.1 myofilin isoform X1 [Bombyx mori]XP_021204937.1 myofilin isoform X1 [Bombyx mori]